MENNFKKKEEIRRAKYEEQKEVLANVNKIIKVLESVINLFNDTTTTACELDIEPLQENE